MALWDRYNIFILTPVETFDTIIENHLNKDTMQTVHKVINQIN